MTKAEQSRLVRLRSKLMQMAASSPRGVSRACRHFGISRKTFYKWKQRYDELGDDGLVDQSRIPRNSPRATPAVVVSKILYLRQNYHFGPRKIADYLKRFHSVSVAGATGHRILLRHGMNRLPRIRNISSTRSAGSDTRRRSLATVCKWT